ncbi:hypothetical protein MNBD_GAMMA10-2188 [hydrothermal vent metagenome]|uniref:GTPase n=1 Tax=hydrothermal vent metagenome TaxID=652676 RepID=A0A3B0XET9_9ZZZZ
MNMVFVYNADSGVFNTLSDIAHKLISPASYQCNLCNLTHGYFSARDVWVEFLRDLESDIEFLHRDEYIRQYGKNGGVELPAIFIKEGEQLKLWIDKQVIGQMTSTDDLMEMIRAALLKKQSGVEEADNVTSLPV